MHSSQARTYVLTSLDIRGHQYVRLSRSKVFVRPGCPPGPEECVRYMACIRSSSSGGRNSLPLMYIRPLTTLQSAIATLISFRIVGVHWRQSGSCRQANIETARGERV